MDERHAPGAAPHPAHPAGAPAAPDAARPPAGPRYVVPVPVAPPWPATVRDRARVERWSLLLAGAGLGAVVGIELLTRTSLGGPGALLTELGRWTGLVGTYGALLIVVLIARVPWLERAVGLGGLMRWHRILGPLVVALIAAHAVLTTAGYAADDRTSFFGQWLSFLTDYPWMLAATVAAALMVGAGLLSWRVARRRMAYETWWVTHLYFYLAIALGYLHQVLYGQAFADHTWARWLWIGLYLLTLGSILVFRVGAPVARSLRRGLLVHSVVRESADTVSVVISGDVAGLRLRGGQYFGFRFLTRSMWWQSHPYSVSAGSTPGLMRITVKDLGDHSSAVARLRPGTRVVIEGPYGTFTADDRRTGHVVLVGGGVGVAPLRAILDDLPGDVDVDLLYRAPRADALVLRSELEAHATVRTGRMRVRYLVGSRRDHPLDARALARLVPGITAADVYVCGPDDLVRAVTAAAHQLGIPDERVHDEAFSFHSPDHYGFEHRSQETR